MSFPYNLTHNMNPHKRNTYLIRKDKKDSLETIQGTPHFVDKRERASAFTSRGSLTLEAAIVVPIFFFAMLCLAYLLEMMAIQTTMRNGLYSAGKEAAKEAYAGDFLTAAELEQQLIENLGRDRLDKSIIAGGADGINCRETKCHRTTGVMDLSVQYQVEIPVLMFRIAPVTCEENLRVKGWTGYVANAGGATKEELVYVTDTGIVYHKDARCTYLDMSIQSVQRDAVNELRNQSGGRYYPCESCGKVQTDSTLVYITLYGTRYHTSLECKKIKRNIYAISIDEAYGLGGCSKCVK